MPFKPCVELVRGRHCGRLTRGTRCSQHAAAREQARAELPERIYSEPAYRRWRAQVRRRAGGRCEHCGLYEVAGGPAHQADHIIPILDGGARYDPANGQLLCVDCHAAKGAEDRRRRKSVKGLDRRHLEGP